MGDVSEHFSRSELCCPHCHECDLDQRLIYALEDLRRLGPEPIIIHDAFRCPQHNAAVGGVPNSTHMTGEAADLEIVGLKLQQMYDRALKVPAFRNGGIGVYDSNFVHVDVRNGTARWARIKGQYVGAERLVRLV